MKKTLIAGLLAFAVMLTSCATAVTGNMPSETETETSTAETKEKESQEEKEQPIDVSGVFSVGFSKQDITPKGRVPLGGYGNMDTRISSTVEDKIYATFLAVSDANDNTVLIVSLDLLSIPVDVSKTACGVIHRTTGVPEDNIILSCTHTHASVAVGTASPLMDVWNVAFYEALRQGSKAALADRDLTDLYIGTKKIEGFNFVRRYLCQNGGYTGPNFPNPTSPVAHESEADNELQVVKFDRKERKDIVLANFGSHPANSSSSDTYISADYIGQVRDDIEKKTGMNFVFFQAAGGNLNPKSSLSGETKYSDKYTFGKALATQIRDVLDNNMTKADTGDVKAEKRTVTVTVDHSYEDKYELAEKIYKLYYNDKNTNEAQRLIKENGLDSIYSATHIINKHRLGETEDLFIYAFAIGDVAFIGAPYEMFDTNGMEIKNGSPYKMTVICEQANGRNGYFPSALACEHMGYEVTSCPFIPGTAEQMRDEFIDMLNGLYK